MRRRAFLSAVGTLGASASAGCLVSVEMQDEGDQDPNRGDQQGAYSVSLARDSEYFVSVSHDETEMGLFGTVRELRVTLNPQPPHPISGVVLVVDGEQAAGTGVNTAESKVEFDVAFDDRADLDREVELVAVKGGEEALGGYDGGEILERTPLNIQPEE